MKKFFLTAAFFVILPIVFFSCAGGPASYDAAPEAAYGAYTAYEGTGFNSRYESDERMVAYTISISLSVKNPAITRELLLDQVRDSGGFVVRETGEYVTARIPASRMDDFAANAKKLGTVENESKTGTDITDQYRDNVVRLENLKSVRNRYLELLEMANAVSDILSIEKELERVNTEIDLLEGRITYAEQSVNYANITVRFTEKAKPGPIGWIFYGLWLGVKWLFVWN